MKQKVVVFFLLILNLATVFSQEDNPFISFDIPSQNLLKFNRFLLNPTFSAVGEDNSNINLYHRNQWIQFEDSPEIYLASYSGRIGDRTGLGIGLYQQNLGVITNFGILANYAYGIKLSEKSNFTFGFNLSFFSSGLDNGELFPGQPDPALANVEDSSLLTFQPGFNFSYGNFDVGLYAENLVDFNLRTSESVTDFGEKTFSGHLMYTHPFNKASGILQNGNLKTLIRGRKPGDRDFNLSGSLILDLPKIGWLQGGYDDFFGVSAGIGFNLTKRLSLGYIIEKGIDDGIENLGTTHEITFAYSFQPNLTEDRVELDLNEKNELAQLEDEIQEKDDELAQIKKNLEENNMILAELILKQDSLEKAVKNDIEKRFYHLIKGMKGSRSNNNNTVASNSKKNTNSNFSSTNSKPKNINTSGKAIDFDNYTDFADAAKANNIKQKTIENLKSVEGGYYLIANVYSQKTNGRLYRDKFVSKLKRNGIQDADYFLNPRNNLNYVYLKRFDNWRDAIAAYKSDLNNTYQGEMWIFNVNNKNRLRLSNNSTNKSKKNNTNVDSSLATKDPIVEDKKRISSPTNKPLTSTSNKGRVVSTPNDIKEENIDRVNSPSRISNKKTEDSNKTNERVNTPIKKSITPKVTKDAIAGNVDEKTEDEIRELYSRTTSKRRKKAKKGSIINIASLDEGYYIITNVFAVPSNAERFVKKLKNKGLDASYFVNPENNYRYVYIKKHNSWNNAIASYYSNIDNSYFDEMWIMRVNTDYIL